MGNESTTEHRRGETLFELGDGMKAALTRGREMAYPELLIADRLVLKDRLNRLRNAHAFFEHDTESANVRCFRQHRFILLEIMNWARRSRTAA